MRRYINNWLGKSPSTNVNNINDELPDTSDVETFFLGEGINLRNLPIDKLITLADKFNIGG